MERSAYWVVLVTFIHAALTLLLGDDLAAVLHNDLAWLKSSKSTNPVTSCASLDNLNTNFEGAALGRASSKVCKRAITTVATNSAAVVTALVAHDSIVASVIAPNVWRAHAAGIFDMFWCLLPLDVRLTDKAI